MSTTKTRSVGGSCMLFINIHNFTEFSTKTPRFLQLLQLGVTVAWLESHRVQGTRYKVRRASPPLQTRWDGLGISSTFRRRMESSSLLRVSTRIVHMLVGHKQGDLVGRCLQAIRTSYLRQSVSG